MLNLSNVKSDLKSIEIDIKDKYYFIKQNLLEFQLKTTQLIKHISTSKFVIFVNVVLKCKIKYSYNEKS